LRAGVELLVRTLDPTPAVLLSRRLDLLAWNPAAGARLGPFREARNYEALLLPDDGDQILARYAAEPGSADGDGLVVLAGITNAAADTAPGYGETGMRRSTPVSRT
jgi:hypothetical protein